MGLGEIEWQGSALILPTFRSSKLIGQLSSASAASKRQSRQQPICFVAIYIYIFGAIWEYQKAVVELSFETQGPPPQVMSKEILFYDLSVQSSVRANKCFAPNTMYDAFSYHRAHK